MRIRIRGAAENNLRDVDVDFRDGLTVVTGVSGSGKSSLVFDTLHREVERRFVDVFGRPGEGMRLQPVRVRSVTGSGPAVAVGQNLLNRNPASLVATASGLHPFLRLLYARFGERSCPACGAALAVRTADEIVATMVALAVRGKVRVSVPLSRRVRGSQRTMLSVLSAELGRASISVDGRALGSRLSLSPGKPHDIDLLLGSLRGGGALPETRRQAREMLDRTAALGSAGLILATRSGRTVLCRTPLCAGCGRPFRRLEPVHFHVACRYCGGRGCGECAESASVRWVGRSMGELLAASVDELQTLQSASSAPPGSQRLFEEICRRVEALRSVGLGYVGLDRPVPTLSRGEAQRLRLAVALTSRLDDMVHLLDEPTIGQHPRDVESLVASFRRLGGPVIFVEHDRAAALLADRVVEIGPGAGSGGGRLVYSGPVDGLLRQKTHTGLAFADRGRAGGAGPSDRVPADLFVRVRGARVRNLAGIDVAIPVGRLTAITGVSGSGKSTLVEEVLVPSLRKGRPVGCDGLEGPRLRPVVVDQSPIGRNPRSNPATYTGVAVALRGIFAARTGLRPAQFSFNRAEGACPACEGMGAVEVRMRYLPSAWVRCEECAGRRFRPEVLDATVDLGGEALSIADLYARPIAEVARLLSEGGLADGLRPVFSALVDVGLGYLTLGQPSPSLSGGEAQRVKLTKYLGRVKLDSELLILDEPSTGLHPHDLGGLLEVLDRIVRAGATVVVVEHNTDVIRAADWCIDLGPGAGPRGGHVVVQGAMDAIQRCRSSATGKALRAEARLSPRPACTGGRLRPRQSSSIRVLRARANNLQGVSVSIPKGKLTAVTGVSGSGKSSLVRDVLEAEARRRYLESLSLYERQGAREGPEAEVEAVSGLGVTVAISSQRWTFGLRADVGWATDISRFLAVLFATCGTPWCLSCGVAMERPQGRGGWKCPACAAVRAPLRSEDFSLGSYGSACTKCHGVGSLQVPAPGRLIIRPDLPLCAGAMYSPGFFPQGYLCKPGNHGYDMVRALAMRHGFDPVLTPWNGMSEGAQRAFLFGDPEPLTVTFTGKSGRVRTAEVTYRGFYGFVGDWDVGGTYSATQVCPECRGARLRPEFAAVRLEGHTIDELRRMPLVALRAALCGTGDDPYLDPGARSAAQAIRRRLGFLCQVGLGYVHLARVASTLSAGEAQRVRLSGMLGSDLTALTILLDEPSRGLHPREVGALAEALEELRSQGNTVVAVEHDLELVRRADHVVELGPGPGRLGGRVVAQGSPAKLASGRSATGRWLAARPTRPGAVAPARRRAQGELVIQAPRENNLDGRDVRIPLGLLTGVCGVSGSGKSSLCIDILARALVPTKITTSVAREPLAPGRHDGILGAPERTLVLDQVTRGVGSPWRFLGLDARFAAIYAESPGAIEGGLNAERLKRGCSACRGRGHQDLDMGFLPSVRVTCDACEGTGMPPEVRSLEARGRTLADLLRGDVEAALALWGDESRVGACLQAASAVGLGYLVLGQPAESLSGGEVQRLRIASELARRPDAPCFYILDEPTVGQHQDDVVVLTGVLRALVREGHSVLVVEHHPLLLAACDWLVELGPGAGPDGGHVVAEGTPEDVASGDTPAAPYLRRALAEGVPS